MITIANSCGGLLQVLPKGSVSPLSWSPITYVRWNMEKPGPITEQPIVKCCSEPTPAIAIQWFYDSSCFIMFLLPCPALPTMGTWALAPCRLPHLLPCWMISSTWQGQGEFHHLLDWKALVQLTSIDFGNTGGIWEFQGYLLKSHLNWNSEWLSGHKSMHWSWIKCQNLANFHWLLLEHVHGHHYLGCVAIVFKGLHVVTWDQGGGGGGGQRSKSLVVDTSSSTCILILTLHVRLRQYMLF